jgi:hypothetical protein
MQLYKSGHDVQFHHMGGGSTAFFGVVQNAKTGKYRH